MAWPRPRSCNTAGTSQRAYRWFTHPHARRIYPDADHTMHSRIFTSELRAVYSRQGADSRAGQIVDALLEQSSEFAGL
jgi:hypothetical protein